VVWGQPPAQGLSRKANPSSTPTCCNCQLAEGEKAHPSNYQGCRHAKEEMRKRKSQRTPLELSSLSLKLMWLRHGGQFRNPKEGEHLPMEAITRGLVKRLKRPSACWSELENV
jgi:hypothetical protein